MTMAATAKDKADKTSVRQWTDQTGKFSVDAALAGIKQGKVALRKRDGSYIIVPLDSFSDADQDYVRDAVAKDSRLLRGK